MRYRILALIGLLLSLLPSANARSEVFNLTDSALVQGKPAPDPLNSTRNFLSDYWIYILLIAIITIVGIVGFLWWF
jgi:uncharacterized membrane protein YdbT with pleckstrin-like domain